METAFLFSGCEPQPVEPEAACRLKSSQETLHLLLNPSDHPKSFLSSNSPRSFLKTWSKLRGRKWTVNDKYKNHVFMLLLKLGFIITCQVLNCPSLNFFNNLWNIYKHFSQLYGSALRRVSPVRLQHSASLEKKKPHHKNKRWYLLNSNYCP